MRACGVWRDGGLVRRDEVFGLPTLGISILTHYANIVLPGTRRNRPGNFRLSRLTRSVSRVQSQELPDAWPYRDSLPVEAS